VVRELERWASIKLRVNGSLGHSRTTTLARLAKSGITPGRPFRSQPPNGAGIHHLREYITVERVLKALGRKYLDVAAAEYLAPTVLVGGTQAARAKFLGLSHSCYHDRLQRLRQAVRDQAGA
jgi:hypothetical protein